LQLHRCGRNLPQTSDLKALKMQKTALLAGLAVLATTPTYAAAEWEFSLYTGVQEAPSSDVDISGDSVIPDMSFRQQWDGKSAEWPIYGGFRITKWESDTFGYGLDYAHNKVEPSSAFGDFTPYVGAGAGISLPGVEVRFSGSDTFEYQVTGPAATWLAGVRYPIASDWSLFGEYKGTYTQNKVDLEDGGTLSSEIFTNAINIGINYQF